jgi:hypothetical protein
MWTAIPNVGKSILRLEDTDLFKYLKGKAEFLHLYFAALTCPA